jgi:hypothetical protein
MNLGKIATAFTLMLTLSVNFSGAKEILLQSTTK